MVWIKPFIEDQKFIIQKYVKNFLDFTMIIFLSELYSILRGNRTRKLIETRTNSPRCNWEPVGLADQEPTRNVTLVWLCSRHEGWSETGRATRPFSGFFFREVLSSIKISHNSQFDWTPLYSFSIFRTLLCFLACRIQFRSRIRSSSSILMVKIRNRSTHKNEKR